MRKILLLLSIMTLSLGYNSLKAQIGSEELDGRDTDLNIMRYSVSFLTIAPDSRAGAMGDVGAATTPDENSMHWNPSKFAFIDSDFGASLSFTPWLSELVDDIRLYNLGFYKRLDDRQVISASLLYFSLGEIIFTDYIGTTTGKHNPNEFSIDLAYSRKFSDNFSGSLAFRYIHSNLTGGTSIGSSETHAGHSYATDVSFYYQNDKINVAAYDANLAFGVNISNMGAKISYTDDSEKQFIPTNLRLGSAFTLNIDDYNSFMVAADVNKLLIPSTPVRDDSDNVIAGKDDDVSVPVGIFQSFNDAPGGFKEELHEIMYSVGLEYWYMNQFAVRGGYFNEHQTKGNRKYFTLGLGLKLNVIGLDFAYLIPRNQNHPLANTLRFSLSFDIGAYQNNKIGE